MYHPGNKNILEAGDIAGVVRLGNVYTDKASGNQIVPVGLVVSEHRDKVYDEGEFPQSVFLTTGSDYKTHLITDGREPFVTALAGGPEEDEASSADEEGEGEEEKDLEDEAEGSTE